MKKFTVLLIVTLLLGVGAVMAQDATARSKMKRQGQALSNTITSNIYTSNTASTAVQATPATCTGEGRGYGDGSKPRPKDGTGFGAKSGNRQNANTCKGKGQGKGNQNGTAQRKRLQNRHGSCSTASCTANISTTSTP